MIESVVEELADRGWCATGALISAGEARELAVEAIELFARGEFRVAGVGRGSDWRLRPEIRTDRVRWIDPTRPTPAQSRYLERMEELRLELNRALYLGLFEFEAHLAVFPAGSFYRRHLDRSPSAPLRAVSCITYLNEDWQAEEGGALRLYLEADRFVDVLPEIGVTALFLSDRFEHEVLPATRDRAAVTGWFRQRG